VSFVVIVDQVVMGSHHVVAGPASVAAVVVLRKKIEFNLKLSLDQMNTHVTFIKNFLFQNLELKIDDQIDFYLKIVG
jgi:hypothetical protein